MIRTLAVAVAVVCGAASLSSQVHLADAADREAFRSWFTFLADAQFYRATPDVTDCAGLIRHAVRETFRPHTPDWYRQAALPIDPAIPDVRVQLTPTAEGWPLFRVDARRHAEFADARTIVSLNTRPLGRDVDALRPGDLLYFRQDQQVSPDHVMVFVGPSRFEPRKLDWVVYHTGPLDHGPGEVRKTRLADLMRHPATRWRPMSSNPAFVGVFRLAWL